MLNAQVFKGNKQEYNEYSDGKYKKITNYNFKGKKYNNWDGHFPELD